MIENLRSVGWNGVNTAFKALSNTYPDPGFFNPERLPIQVTLLGAGAVGIHVVQAAIQYGDPDLRSRMVSDGVPGVKVTVIDYDITPHKPLMSEILKSTDILVDATQRLDASQPVIPNSWIAYLPKHAIITDLAVDPYTLETDPPVVRGIEGIPQGNLNKYIFPPDDPDWGQTIPPSIPSNHRRTTVSCYSWPGILPEECMDHYGDQLKPFMRLLLKKGYKNLNPQGSFHERSLYRASLKGWLENHPG
jgi:alanine dehydrogenase